MTSPLLEAVAERGAGSGALRVASVAIGTPADALESLLTRAGVAGLVGSPEDVSTLAPDVVVVACDRLERTGDEIRALHGRVPAARFVVVAASATAAAVREALRGGADAVLLEDEAEQMLPLAIRAVAKGYALVPHDLHAPLAKPALSSREKQILGMVVLGFSNGEIARQFFLAESTVKSHLSSAFSKLGVRSRNEATALILDEENGFGTGILAISGEAERLGPERQP